MSEQQEIKISLNSDELSDEKSESHKKQVQSYLQRGYIITADTDHFTSMKKPINHALHIILTLLTFWILGGWLWIYMCILIFSGRRVNIRKV